VRGEAVRDGGRVAPAGRIELVQDVRDMHVAVLTLMDSVVAISRLV